MIPSTECAEIAMKTPSSYTLRSRNQSPNTLGTAYLKEQEEKFTQHKGAWELDANCRTFHVALVKNEWQSIKSERKPSTECAGIAIKRLHTAQEYQESNQRDKPSTAYLNEYKENFTQHKSAWKCKSKRPWSRTSTEAVIAYHKSTFNQTVDKWEENDAQNQKPWPLLDV